MKLRSIIKKEVGDALEAGSRISQPEFTRYIMDTFPEECDEFKTSAILIAIGRIVRDCAKAVSREFQPLLPGLSIPQAVLIKQDDESLVYVATKSTSIAELGAAIALLEERIQHDLKAVRSLKRIKELCIDNGGKPSDIVGDILFKDTTE